MSYETMFSTTHPCRCGNGTFIYAWEYDDDRNEMWRSVQMCCPRCRAEDAIEYEKWQKAEQNRQDCLARARALAEDRYLQRWLDRFSNCTRRAAWLLYTDGKGYPCLQTFYKHVRHPADIAEYMMRCFREDVERALRQLQVCDEEIDVLLATAKCA